MKTATSTTLSKPPSTTTDASATHGRPVVKQDGDCVVVSIPMMFRKRNGRKQIVLPPGVRAETTKEDDARCPLRVALARAYRWQKMIESGEVRSAGELARRLKLDRSFIARTLRLAALAPDVVEAVLRGDEPDGLSLGSLRGELPLSWDEQRRLYPHE